jgi:tight adherence protein B
VRSAGVRSAGVRSAGVRSAGAVLRRPALAVAAACVASASVCGFAAGPVAAGLAAVYGGGAAALLVRRSRFVRRQRAIAATLDTVAEMAAELRAGASPAVVVEAAEPLLAATPRERASVRAACEVSERTGAPLAEVLDRVETCLRQANRLRLAVAAHRAGTRATALLLAVLPAGGVAVGYGMGADPLQTLLHTSAGAACAALACTLQVAGLLWTERLSKVDL